MLENQLFHHKLHCNGWKSWSWGLKRSWVQRAHSQTATQPVFLSPLSKKCFLLMWTFMAFSILKVSLHRLQEECSPLQQPCKQYLSAGRARPARKSPGGKKTRLQSSIRTNARKCLPARQETLQNRQKRRPSRGKQATKQKTNCS